MLQELKGITDNIREQDHARQNLEAGKKEFLEQYSPIRKAFEEYLAEGRQIEAPNLGINILDHIQEGMLMAMFQGHVRTFPYWVHEATIHPFNDNQDVQLYVSTQSEFGRPFHREIDKSWIIVVVKEPTEGFGAQEFLPPIAVLEKSPDRYIHYLNIPNQVHDLVPFLTSAK